MLQPKRLKLNRSFTPLPTDEGDELFANGIFVFNITKMLAFIAANPDKFPVENVDVKTLAVFDVPDHLNEETIRTANLSSPIVLAEISPEGFNVIDGNHRVAKGRRDRLEKIPAYRVAADQHLAFLTSEKAYEIYVDYWNSKVDDRQPRIRRKRVRQPPL